MTLLYTDPAFLDHDTGPHPETAERLRAIGTMLDETGLRGRCTPGRFAPLDPTALLTVHTPQVVDTLNRFTIGSCVFGDFVPYVRPGRS